MAEKADPFNHKNRWLTWKKTLKLKTRFGSGLTKINHDLIVEYLLDMEAGYNAARRGGLSYIRLNTLRQRIVWLLETMNIPDIRTATRKQVLFFFNKMDNGQITRHNGKKYRSVTDYIKIFKAFWHWYQRREQENHRTVKDITIDLDRSERNENEFVYFTFEELKKVLDHCKYDYRIYLWFLFDSGIRAPTELMSLKNGDFHWQEQNKIYELDIKDSYAKTFGRKIKLILSSEYLIEFLKGKDPAGPFLTLDWKTFSIYIKRIFFKILGDRHTKGGKKISEIRPYDFRHSAACYWRPRYKNVNAYMYRFGWKEMNMVNYYTKFLGMRDTISQDDLIVDSEAKTKLELQLEQERKNRALMEERLQIQEKQINDMNRKFEQINSFMNTICEYDHSLINAIADKAKSAKLKSC